MPPCSGENMKRLMKLLFTVVLLCQTAPSNGDTFEDRASNTLSLVEKKFHISDCIDRARKNANKVSLTGDKHNAVLWINMLSQYCKIDWKWNSFPLELNKELRCKHFQRDPEELSIFLNVSSIINEALNYFNPRKYTQLFRGITSDWPFVDRDLFVEEGFFSSSKDIDIAVEFATGNILLVVQELNGVDIANYADELIKFFKEVIGTSGKLFKIERKVSDEQEISDLMSYFKLTGKFHSKYPGKVLFVREISASQQLKDKVINEQKHLLEETCSTKLTIKWDDVIYVTQKNCILGISMMIWWLVSGTLNMIWWLVSGTLNMIWWLVSGTLNMIWWLVGGTLNMLWWIVGGTLQMIGWLLGGILDLFKFSEQEGKQGIENTDL